MLLWCWTLIKESFLPRNLSLWSNVGETGVRLISSVTRYVISSVNSLTSITLVILSGAFEWACKIACKSGAALDSSGGKRWEVAENVFVSTTCWSTLNWHAGCTVQRQVAELSSKRFGRQHITTGVWVRTSHLKCMEQRASKSFRMNHETTKSIWGRLWPPILSHIESPAKSVPLPDADDGHLARWMNRVVEDWRMICHDMLDHLASYLLCIFKFWWRETSRWRRSKSKFPTPSTTSCGNTQAARSQKKCQNWFQSVELPEHQMIKAAT